jgi:hypothetical protein
VKTRRNAHAATAIERSDQAWQIHRRGIDRAGVKRAGKCALAPERNEFGREAFVEKGRTTRCRDGYGLANVTGVTQPNARESRPCS